MNVVNLIKNAENILIVGHVKPDGDCFGAGLSLLRLCENLGKNAYFVCDSELSSDYSFMQGYEKTNVFTKRDFDLLIVVDCGDSTRMGKYKEYLKKANISVNIDHHITNNGFAKINHVKPSMSSTCQMVYELLEKEKVIDSVIAELLYVGLSTDTGHFMHNTVTKEVFDIASHLVELGANPSEVATKLYKSRTIAKTKLIVKAIQSMRFFNDNRVAFITLQLNDLSDCGCTLSDTEGLIDYAISIREVEIACCIAEQKERVFKVGLRSKGANVSRVAAVFGGGGHIRAAGCMISGFKEDVIDKLSRVIDCELSS